MPESCGDFCLDELEDNLGVARAGWSAFGLFGLWSPAFLRGFRGNL